MYKPWPPGVLCIIYIYIYDRCRGQRKFADRYAQSQRRGGYLSTNFRWLWLRVIYVHNTLGSHGSYNMYTDREQDSPGITSQLNHYPTNVFCGPILSYRLHLQLKQGRRMSFYTVSPETFWTFNKTKQKWRGITCVHVHLWPCNLVVMPNIQPVSSIGLRTCQCMCT